MSRTPTFVRRMVERRNARDFERALRTADPAQEAELRAIAARHIHRIV